MADEITTDDVLKIAHLARLTLSQGDAEHLQRDMTNTFRYIDKLNSLDIKGVLETTHAASVSGKLGKDEVHASLNVDDGLRNAPERLGDGFGVPKIIE